MEKRDITFDHKWEMQFFELKKFQKKYGHCDVPQNKKGYAKLARWCGNQRRWKKFRPLEYDPDRIRKLDSIGFSWSVPDKWFEKNFKKIQIYILKYGHSSVFPSEDKSLHKWCSHLREDKKHKAERLTDERIKRLNSIGFDWDPDKNLYDTLHFEERLSQLKEFLSKSKKYPLRGDKKYPFLSTWVERQRYDRRYGIISKERIKKLDAIGFLWDPNKETWENSFEKLKLFKKDYGHCNVPHSQSNTKHYSLASWCDRQRQLYKEKSKLLSIQRIQKLNSIEFSWIYALKQGELVRNKTSNEMLLTELKRIYKKLGRAPKYEDLKKYSKYKKGKYTLRFGGYRNALIQAGLQNVDEEAWNNNFNALKAFIKKTHRQPITAEPGNKSLSIWITNQRRLKKRGQLSSGRVHSLNSINFPWNPHDIVWENNFEKLKAYKKEFGHCNVPESGIYEKLGAWVGVQRRYYTRKIKSLTSARIKKLNSIEFSWKTPYKSK